jgi:NAD(P)-dependent dehydrogenase (short-subunit alcohol dehydrogenase family)
MPQKQSEPEQQRPPQAQERQPGLEAEMRPRPRAEDPGYKGSGKLQDRVALITGGDSGIGRAVAIAFAREGADLSVVYYNEHEDAAETKRQVEQEGQNCFLIAGDVGREAFCQEAVQKTVQELGRLDILVNNAAVQFPQESILDINEEQLERTFRTNIYAYFFMTKAALKHLKPGSAIINSTSVTAYRGSSHLIDYASTKGAIVAFTRSLAQSLVDQGIRVNGVAPGPVWTPLIPASFEEDKVAQFGSDSPMGRAAEPEEIAPSYVFLASDDGSYFTGQVLHPNGGEIVNG